MARSDWVMLAKVAFWAMVITAASGTIALACGWL
jgi:hypothetical protein